MSQTIGIGVKATADFSDLEREANRAAGAVRRNLQPPQASNQTGGLFGSLFGRQQRPQDLARLTEALHRWFAGDAELERILSVWIQEYLLRDLRPELNVPEAHDLGEITMQLAERFKLWEQEVAQKALQQGLQQGAQKGRLEGLQQGLQKGKLEGEALLLQRMLIRRFGSLPEWAQQRLRSATSEELETWADRVLDATRLEDVFGA